MSVPHSDFPNIPRTIFDQDENDVLDMSEEMEEIRELLYELIKSNFAAGVMVDHLAKVYKESYESTGNGPALPNDWLEHIRVADEFEVVNRGPIVMVYTRQRTAAPLKLESPAANPLKISKGLVPSEKKEPIRIRLTDRELAQQMKPIIAFESIPCPCTLSVVIVACDDATEEISVQLASSRPNFEQMRSLMHTHYENLALGEPVTEPEIGGVYAVKDVDDHWYRAILEDMSAGMLFSLVDTGKEIAVDPSRMRRLRAEFALPRIYPMYAIAAHTDLGADPAASSCAIRAAFHTQQPIPLRFLGVDNSCGVYSVQCIGCSPTTDTSSNLPLQRSPLNPTFPTVPPLPTSVTHDEVILVPMECSEMPKSRFPAHVLAVFDSENISIRQCSLDPIPDYILSAVTKDSLAQPSPPTFSELIAGRFFAAKLQPDSKWERVLLLGPSAVDSDCFRIYAVDIGSYGVVRKHAFRHLKVPGGLRKIMMAKCKIAGIRPSDGSTVWSRESQVALSDILLSAKNVEVEPLEEWSVFPEPNPLPVPFVSARIFTDGKDVSKLLTDQGFALFA